MSVYRALYSEEAQGQYRFNQFEVRSRTVYEKDSIEVVNKGKGMNGKCETYLGRVGVKVYCCDVLFQGNVGL